MTRSYDDEDDKVNYLDIQQNLIAYCLKKLNRLANDLIDSLSELTAENDFLEGSVENHENEKIVLTIQISELGEQFQKLTFENNAKKAE